MEHIDFGLLSIIGAHYELESGDNKNLPKIATTKEKKKLFGLFGRRKKNTYTEK